MNNRLIILLFIEWFMIKIIRKIDFLIYKFLLMKMKISSGVCYVKYYFSKIDNFIVLVEEFVVKNFILVE